jgi:hypothetical protein
LDCETELALVELPAKYPTIIKFHGALDVKLDLQTSERIQYGAIDVELLSATKEA